MSCLELYEAAWFIVALYIDNVDVQVSVEREEPLADTDPALSLEEMLLTTSDDVVVDAVPIVEDSALPDRLGLNEPTDKLVEVTVGTFPNDVKLGPPR